MWPWIIGLVLFLAWFGYWETKALMSPRPDTSKTNWTLSYFVYTIGAHFPLSIFLMGLIVGGLAVHFYWHWCPAGSIQGG